MDPAKPSKSATARVTRKTTCSSCRHRKSKCDGRKPQCSTCIAYRSQCCYDKPPSLTYVRSLETKIERLEQELASNNSAKSDTEICWSGHSNRQRSPPTHGDTVSPSNWTVDGSPHSKGTSHHWASEISIDSRGGVCYHNPTSAIHEAPENEQRSNHGSSLIVCSPETLSVVGLNDHHDSDEVKQALVSNAATQRRIEVLAMENMVQDDVSKEMASELLMLHWCWMHPMFMTVYRPAFIRDMALTSDGHRETPYFSDTLLKVIFAHSSRFFVQSTQGQNPENKLMDVLTNKALFSLSLSITRPSSIPTIQALLQQAAREIAFGRSSQAWLYSGMGFRMAIDLGIHLPSDKLRTYVKTLTAEDIEIRKRLFWSCYTFDKAISLYLGRMPAFIPPLDSHEIFFMDDFTEHDLWEPFYGSAARDPARSTEKYLPTKGHVISCFTALCKLSIILSSIMLDIYGSSLAVNEPRSNMATTPMSSSVFLRISSHLQSWLNSLPKHLRLHVKKLPNLSPPPHIVSLNLLYHTTLILLHRPFILGPANFDNPAVSRSYQICTIATAAIHDLLDLLTTTFGYSHITYLNSYSAYIAATIAVLHFRWEEESCVSSASKIPEDKLGLKFFLGILQKTATAMPALGRSVEIVKRHMQAILDRQSKRYLDSLFSNSDNINHSTSDQRNMPFGNNSSSRSSIPLGSFSGPPQNGSSNSIDGVDPTYSNFNLEGLPAFPGQYLNMGMDYTFDPEVTDPDTRAALMGLNLDPHLTLHHGYEDWDYNGVFDEERIQ